MSLPILANGEATPNFAPAKVSIDMYSHLPTDAAVDVARIEAEARAMRSATVAQFGAACGRGIFGTFRKLAGTFAEARRMHRTYAELSGMSDRELRDMGITRSDIPAIVAGTFTREPIVVATETAPKPAEAPRPALVDEDLRIAA